MSEYTTEVRFICESALGMQAPQAQSRVNWIVQQAWPLVFDFDFPIFDESYRPTLCQKILKHFYTREIGEETVGLWKLRLDTKLNEIMPYYNLLYASGVREFNPLWDTDMTTEHKGKTTGDTTREETIKEGISRDRTQDTTSKSETDTDNVQDQNDEVTTFAKQQNTRSDTPQGGLDGLVTDDYLTEATMQTNDGRSSTSSHLESTGNAVTNESQNVIGQENEDRNVKTDTGEATSTTQDYITRVFGRQGGSVADKLEALKSELLNIDMMIIRELEPLFMTIW